ncbi:MAG TPA: DUF1287 domain-containing protein [Thiotrichaceae bacterium]|nr:DUF1287 domain-containing protein [Thiotrichaceae bacterium]
MTTTYKPRSQAQAYRQQQHTQQRAPKRSSIAHRPRKQATPRYNAFSTKLAYAALNRTRHNIRYDGRYIKIGYPWGDVPQNIGVCTDVVIRSYRKLGIDLQQQVHQDMTNNFLAYPNLSKWNLKAPDPNIDHRRVYNLRVFLARHAQALPRSRNPLHYQPGDLITWQLGPGQGHIGIVSNQRSKADPKRFLVVHNIAEGPKLEDVLFRYPMSGHYRYSGKMKYKQSHYTQYKLPTTLPTKRETTSLLNIPSELLR